MNKQNIRYIVYLIFSTLLSYALSFLLFKAFKFAYLTSYSKGCLTYVIQYICFYFLAKPIIKKDLKSLINKGEIKKNYLIYFLIFIILSLLVNIGSICLNTYDYTNKIQNILCVLFCTYFVASCEETIYRVLLSKLIKNRIVFVIASSILFAIAHTFSNSMNLFELLYYFLFGILLGVIAQNTTGYKTGILIHALNNFIFSLLITNNINNGPSLLVWDNNIKLNCLLLCVLLGVVLSKDKIGEKDLWNI